MIPNFAPMAAVYLRFSDSTLFSLPVAAWSENGNAMVPYEASLIELNESLMSGADLMGISHGTWTPNLDEMASLLPDITPDNPRPKTGVTIWSVPGGWAARHTDDKSKCVAEAVLLDNLLSELDVLGGYRVDRIAGTDEY